MSTRQNKKRKGRSNVINRERTVTTLTDGSEGSFLIPTTPEEPAGNIMSPPFPIALSGSSGAQNISPAFNTFPTFPAYNGYMAPLAAPAFAPQRSQPFFPPPSQGMPGQNDLEVLERLKESIKNGQHEFFRAIPQPAVLADLYMGPNSSGQVPPHPEQVPPDYQHSGFDVPLPHNGHLADNGSFADINGGFSDRNNRTQPQDIELRHDKRNPMMTQPSVSDLQSDSNNVAQSTLPSSKSDVSMGLPTPPSNDEIRVKSENSPIASDTSPAGLHDKPEATLDTSRSGHSGYQQADSKSIGRTTSDRSLAAESTTAQKPLSASPSKSSLYDSKDDIRQSRDTWPYRNGSTDKPRIDSDRRPGGEARPSNAVSMDARGSGPGPRFHDRERDRDKDRDWERDRDRDRRSDYARYRDDQRSDERSRVSDTRRPYESRWADARRYDTKPSDSSNGPVRVPPPSDDRSSLEHRPTRSLGEERSINRLHSDNASTRSFEDRRPPGPSSTDERPTKVLPAEDRRGPAPPQSDRPREPDDRRPLPSSAAPAPTPGDRVGRPYDDRRAPPPSIADRQARPVGDDRRTPGLLLAVNDRQTRVSDDRRPPPPGWNDDRRGPVPSVSDRQVRLSDDRRPVPAQVSDRSTRLPIDDSRTPLPPSGDRAIRPPGEERRPPPPVTEDRDTRVPLGSLSEVVTSRPPLDDRGIRQQPSQDDPKPRSVVPLEDRLSRPPPLQERLASSSSRPDDRVSHPPVSRTEHGSHPPRSEDRRVVPTLEERLSHAPAGIEDRGPRPPPTDDSLARTLMPPPASVSASASASARPAAVEDRNVHLADSARPALGSLSERDRRPDDRGRPLVSDRVSRPTEHANDRGPPRSTIYSNAPTSRAASVARDSSRGNAFKPHSPTHSPVRSELREFRPAAEPPRPSYRHEPDRYTNDRRGNVMDVDTPASRFASSYRRPSSPVVADTADPYISRGRTWSPNETYPEESARRGPVDPHSYDRNRRADYPSDWESMPPRHWDRPIRDYERENYLDGDPAARANGWETREERERRISSSFPLIESTSTTSRAFEQRPLGTRLSEDFTRDDHQFGMDVLERTRYAPVDIGAYSRVRARSPSPLRRQGAVTDLRPAIKRPREDTYTSSYYTLVDQPRPLPEDLPRLRSSPSAGAPYFDDPRAPPPYGGSTAPAGNMVRDRDYVDARERAPETYPSYERRDPVSRISQPRSPSQYNGRYSREDRRYSVQTRS
ncbi:uncharacterized protein FIBRA_05321 [Fibroporia radiculosa]|uniref:Uncharacterized protein n=1 Tax=Fibroporia radiculosa TaxID=599839 RepID=J4HXB4_9APHY|nr:uncharacterized protein FIBRA_05321 [Fibroporia radiculosa]CCM03197.1 predicted protein [Fibroporia radiculosa]